MKLQQKINVLIKSKRDRIHHKFSKKHMINLDFKKTNYGTYITSLKSNLRKTRVFFQDESENIFKTIHSVFDRYERTLIKNKRSKKQRQGIRNIV